jgi:hypothetical protein
MPLEKKQFRFYDVCVVNLKVRWQKMRYLHVSRMLGMAVLLLPAALSNGVVSAADALPLNSTVCELVRDSARFLNTPVMIRARINSNGMDRASLSSADCPGDSLTLEHMGIESAPSNVGRDALFTATFRIGSIGTVDKEIAALLVGRITMIGSDGNRSTFRISDVREMTVVWKNMDTLTAPGHN